MTIQKIGNASTLNIITAIKNLLPKSTTLPQDFKSASSQTIGLRPWRDFRILREGAYRGMP